MKKHRTRELAMPSAPTETFLHAFLLNLRFPTVNPADEGFHAASANKPNMTDARMQ